MNRANLFLMSVGSILLGGGCGTCETDVAVFWHFPGEATCSQVGVATVNIFVDGNAVGNFDCTLLDVNGNPAQGLTLTAFAKNVQYSFQVDGIDASGTAVYSGTTSYTPTACGVYSIDVTLAATQGSVTLDLSGGDFKQCPANAFIWYSLTDITNPQAPSTYDVVDGLSKDPKAVPCVGAVSFTDVPVGRYQFDFVQVVTPTGPPDQPYVATWQQCTPVPFDHNGDDIVKVPLQVATATCPGS